MKKSILQECLKKARLGLSNHPQLCNYPHFTFLIRDNQIFANGVNRTHEPDKGFGYHNRILKDDFRPKWHSELDALLGHRRYSSFYAVNIRLNKEGLTRMACPCSVCYKLLQSFGCKICWFSTPNDQWGKICYT